MFQICPDTCILIPYDKDCLQHYIYVTRQIASAEILATGLCVFHHLLLQCSECIIFPNYNISNLLVIIFSTTRQAWTKRMGISERSYRRIKALYDSGVEHVLSDSKPKTIADRGRHFCFPPVPSVHFNTICIII